MGSTPQLCSATGTWESGASCPYLCTSGACTGVCSPTATQCSGTDVQMCDGTGQWQTESDPIWAVEASAGGFVISEDGYSGQPAVTGSGYAPDGEPVTFTVWTAPGVMSSPSVLYWLNSSSTEVTTLPLVDAGVNSIGLETWTASLAAQPLGTTVTWWAQGGDVCNSWTNYFSNSGNNYVYDTE
jgi:hypothetical protein